MSASLIGWIVSIVFIVIVASGFLVGFWRGLKRSTVSLVISIVGALVAFFVTPAITNAILKIQINMNGEAVALQTIILNALTSNEEIASLVDKNPSLETFFLNLPQALVNVVLFMLVTIAIECILYVIYKILAMAVFKIKPEEKKHRLSGGIVGAVKSFIIVLFAFMPLASLIGVASTCTNSGDYGIQPAVQEQVLSADAQSADSGEGESSSEETSLIPESVTVVIDGLENNLLTKMCGVFGLDNALFDYYGSFDVDGEKIVVREEIVNVYNAVDIVSQLSKVDSTYSFKDINYEKITTQFNALSDSPLFESILADTLGELIINYKDYSFIRDSQFVQDNAEIVEAISLGLKAYTEAGGKVSDYFTDDINMLVEVASSLGQNGTIDDIAKLETINAEGIIKVLTNDDNYENTKTNLQKLFSMNLVRDGIEEIAKKAVTELSSEVDKIGVSTDTWQDEDWNSLSDSIASVAKIYSKISDKVDVMKVISDPTILLDETKNYDISGILSNLGSLIDEARAVNLLQTSENKPIIDKLLSKYNIPLPDGQNVIAQVVENDGTAKTIKTHKQLFDFISPSLVKMRDEKIYSTITAQNTTNEKLTNLALIVSEEGNETLLSDIIMPLYQVEPTKSLIVNQVTGGLKSDLVDMTSLSGYVEWKADLNYISAMLKIMNSRQATVYVDGTAETKTFLELALANNLDAIVDSLQEADVEPIIKPIFYAKSTSAVEQKIIDKISTDLALFTKDSDLKLIATDTTFVNGDAEDQTQEFCNILKKLLPLKTKYILAGEDLKKVDKTVLSEALSAMQANAYRVENSSKTVNGIFKDTFVSLMSQFKSEYQTEITVLEMDPDTLEEKIGVRSFAEDNYSKIDFDALMELLATTEA